MQKIIFFFFGLMLLFPFFALAENDVLADEEILTQESTEEETILYYFGVSRCPVCHEAEEFLEKIKDDYPQLKIIKHSITDSEKLQEVALQHGVEDPKPMAPSIFIGENYFQFNYFRDGREGQQLIDAIEGEAVEKDCCIVVIPFLNIEVDIRDWSLPLMTALLGSIDGFNVCSLGALILVLSIVMGFRSRRKIFFYGGLFIFTAATIYGLLVFAGGQILSKFLGHLEILNIIIGIAALLGGIYFFKEFWRFFNYGPTCKSSENRLAKKVTAKLQQTFQSPQSGALALIGGIVFFAAIITLVELPCSIGLPIAFAGILTEAGVTFNTFIFYVILYIFFYMLIELIIFVGAVLTKELWIAGSNLVTWVTLLGALVLFYLSYYYLFGL